jgi:hypothetical protein
MATRRLAADRSAAQLIKHAGTLAQIETIAVERVAGELHAALERPSPNATAIRHAASRLAMAALELRAAAETIAIATQGGAR